MSQALTRRQLLGTLAGAVAATAVPSAMLAATPRFAHMPIGYTGITWTNAQVEDAITTCAKLGFYGFETFGDVLDKWEPNGGLKPVLQTHGIQLISGYCTLNLTDKARREETLGKAKSWAQLIQKNGGRIFVLGPNPVKRDSYVYSENKQNIIETLNEAAKIVSDQGLTPVLHQHTGTCIETRDETYATLDAIDHMHLKFGPDVGQLKKGGVDPVKVVKDYLPQVQHMHLKDFDGKDRHLVDYCPLGEGQVNIPAILNLMAGRKIAGMVMVELDNDPKDPSPVPAAELAGRSQQYLKKIGWHSKAS
jgi:inosose dehydratase